ncbi:sulfurtransferase complex subunit TusB [Colwellia sp. M166]|uniref:sulfurtransferase complex subunit TusB n=1 Tax=Colwellia sp. M166 TaxID=2583805 RepID=UPI00211DF10C|nr:sulfurtransferase complex subunit TusB [Colwellia sp. M166]UUO22276.1 sulfurtransferase complex subunit TusB [Colwellia sp. M166]|tara:strand:- start:2065 stop:2361 length:297 start_codon:yes stop_codon:yes gene_type:complete
MAMLHIIRNSGFTNNTLSQCLNMSLPQDAILLMDDGCYNLQHPLLLEALTKQAEITVYYVSLHASARAQNSEQALFTAISFDDVLKLIFTFDNSITWS